MPSSAADAFWQYSLALYGQPGAADACLRLQDDGGADVNILLFCLWDATRRGQPLSAADIESVVAAVAPWQDRVIRPLRGVRRALRQPLGAAPRAAETLRQQVKRQELEAERAEQEMLARHGAAEATEPVPQAAALAAGGHNLCAYSRRLAAPLTEKRRADLTMLLSLAFPAASAAELATALPG